MKTESKRSPYLRVLEVDDAIPIDDQARTLWLRDIDRPTRWFVRPLLQFLFALVLHLTWYLKRLPLPQFSNHHFLQRTICWFCKYFVTPEASVLILRHFATESNILNFLIDNAPHVQIPPIELYPSCIDDMMQTTFVNHDQELFRIMHALGQMNRDPSDARKLNWTHWRPVEVDESIVERRWTQLIDFETAHALFMCLFCLLLTAEEYRDAINGFNLDQSIAIRAGHLIGDNTLVELAYNKHPLYLVGPWNLSQRFLMHGFFTEQLFARLEQARLSADYIPGPQT